MLSDDGSGQRKAGHGASWPVVDGSYVLGDPAAPIAVCALTSDELLKPLAGLSGVAIAGEVQTANLGIERIILNITANPSIRFLLLCGKESRLFRPGQTLEALMENGVDPQGRVIGAQGYEPVLQNISREQIDVFRNQVELIDWVGEREMGALQERIGSLVTRNPGRFEASWEGKDARETAAAGQARFLPIRPGGRREPLIYDPKGYFVITLDRQAGQIVLRHYQPDHAPAHEMRGRSAESMVLGLLREGLVSQLSHAGYLGTELAKAEAALRLGNAVRYEQDRPLHQEESSEAEVPTPAGQASETAPASMGASSMPAIAVAQTWAQFQAIPVGEEVNVTCKILAQPVRDLLEGVVVEPSEREPFNLFHQTEYPLRIHWTEATRVIMGEASQVQPEALLRVRGRRHSEGEVAAEALVILTHVARIES
jgi:tetrahydromethanopterin S-methyltransferase subunit A